MDQSLTNAFQAPSFPCNPRPFANAISEGVATFGTDWIKSDDAKCILFVLISQSYGQMFTLDGFDEFKRLKASTVA